MGENTQETIVLSKHAYGGVDYRGTLYVDDTSDDDWVGLIFSYQSLEHFYALVSAKHTPSNIPKTHDKGPWRLVRVRSSTGATSSHLSAAIVNLQPIKNQTSILWIDPSRQVHWI